MAALSRSIPTLAIAISAAALVGWGGQGNAADADVWPPSSGVRVRAVVPDASTATERGDDAEEPPKHAPNHTVIGRFVEVRDRTLLVEQTAADTIALPLAEVRRLEVSTGRGNKAKTGVRIGFLAGVACGIAAGAILADELNDGSSGESYSGAAYVVSIAGGALLGIGFGAAIGSCFGGERWARVPPDEYRVGARRDRGGGVRLGVRFALDR